MIWGKMGKVVSMKNVANSYVYLVFMFATTMSSFQGAKQLAVKGKNDTTDIVPKESTMSVDRF